MRLHFQEEPWDLYLAIGYTVIIAAISLAFREGNLLGILLVLFVPGHVLVAALFPGSVVPEKPEIDWIERIALSIGLSIAVVPVLGFLLNFTPWGIRFAPIVATITIFTSGVGYAAYLRRMRLPPGQRLSLTVDIALPRWKEYGAVDKCLTITLAASILVASGTLAYVIVTPRPGEAFTEFYILGPGGNASGYPAVLNVSQPGSVILIIANHETASVNYAVRIDLVGVRIGYNATAQMNETVELNRTTWSWFNVTLEDGRTWSQTYTFSILSVGLWRVQFLLYKDGVLTNQKLHLFVKVT